MLDSKSKRFDNFEKPENGKTRVEEYIKRLMKVKYRFPYFILNHKSKTCEKNISLRSKFATLKLTW